MTSIMIPKLESNTELIRNMKKITRGTALGAYIHSRNKSDYHKRYYVQNYADLTTKRTEIITCKVCARSFLKANKSIHIKSRVHLACLGNKADPMIRKIKASLITTDNHDVSKHSQIFSKKKIDPLTIRFD